MADLNQLPDELKEIYEAIIADHNSRPRNHRAIEHPSHQADGHNPLCGDEVTIYVNEDTETIADVSFTGQGCMISQASASLLTLRIKGKTIDEARREIAKINKLLTDTGGDLVGLEEEGDIVALQGVRFLPQRVKCATLPWHTLEAALDDKAEVTTEA